MVGPRSAVSFLPFARKDGFFLFIEEAVQTMVGIGREVIERSLVFSSWCR